MGTGSVQLLYFCSEVFCPLSFMALDPVVPPMPCMFCNIFIILMRSFMCSFILNEVIWREL